ncbi:RHS repeat-associated core domain-containing protein [Chryseobacterium nematophagum]|uniref:RHS repeat-associated core domain-containing protein n=1 Tax=Chryseobacterium nematophagum TaxID=2305228 RepID=A0A3M7TGB5_9FLAO|nr:RHS repeat-associated core domain-containing protein [Chryseobacterium nematophagum]RNA61957.1 RHS repeat-associated core domain-containing protein [Chryseobacterium nematophagum]
MYLEYSMGQPMQIDNLSYTYSGNRLTKVTDATQSSYGYPGGGNPIGYDNNGNMISHPDKGINTISYNFLNLPSEIKSNSGNSNAAITNYIYRADGIKVAKNYILGGTTKETQYLNGFQYDNSNASNVLASSSSLKFVPTAEGYFDFIKNKYIYNYTDHLGNVRLSYFNNGSSVEVLEENNYYPFGLKHEGYNILNGNPSYQYKYNGKELQETGMYDYGARMYMSEIGRWGVVDPAAELGRRFSPYNYAFDNPVMFIDPDGMWPWPTWGQFKNMAKTYYSGMYQRARSVVKETYHGVTQVVTHPVATAKAIAKDPVGVVKAGVSKSAGLMASVAVTPAIVKDAVKTGNATTAGNVAGKVLATAVIEGGSVLATEGAVSAVSSIRTASRMSKLSSEVSATASELSATGKAPATVVGAELNGQTTIATSGAPPSVIAPQLEGAVNELRGIGTKTASGNTVGCCAEFQAGNELLLNNLSAAPSQINFTEAVRPRTGQAVPMCDNCKATFGN